MVLHSSLRPRSGSGSPPEDRRPEIQQLAMDKNRNKTSTRPLVTVEQGPLRGRSRVTPDGQPYYSFQGIPFAKPPLGELRFKAPVPVEPWGPQVRDAGHEGNFCPQPPVQVKVGPKKWTLKSVSAFMSTMPALVRRVAKAMRQSEDCLYLNVYTPELPRGEASSPRPVLFWIHGGAFLVGDGDADVFGPEYFIEQGAVVVSCNYRLGAFGFLSVGTSEAPGNAGLKDQTMALRWVRDNIAAFGGDPNKVTIYGESAGSVSVHLHTLSPLSRGLFHAAIAGSGTALHDWAISTRVKDRSFELGKLLGASGEAAEDPDQLVAFLRTQSADKLVHYTIKMKLQERFIGHDLAFMPTIEKPGPDAFLSEPPEDILRRGAQADVPIILGVNDREGLLWFVGNPAAGPRLHVDEELQRLARRTPNHLFLPDSLHDVLSPEERAAVHKQILDHYFGEKGLCKETLPEFIDLFGDLLFINHIYITSRLHAAASTTPMYVYHFSYDGRLGFLKRLLRLKHAGAAHSDELGYLFTCHILPEVRIAQNSPEMRCRKTMMKLWMNFMKTGKPTTEDDDLKVSWPPASANEMPYLEIGDEVAVKTGCLGKHLDFWDGIYRKYLDTPIVR